MSYFLLDCEDVSQGQVFYLTLLDNTGLVVGSSNHKAVDSNFLLK